MKVFELIKTAKGDVYVEPNFQDVGLAYREIYNHAEGLIDQDSDDFDNQMNYTLDINEIEALYFKDQFGQYVTICHCSIDDLIFLVTTPNQR